MNKPHGRIPARSDTAKSVVGRLIGTAESLKWRVETALAAAGLSMAKVSVLEILVRADDPMPLSDLAEHSRCVRSNITQLVDRLEKDGLVRRIFDASDRRVRRAELTPAGRQAHAAGMRILETQERELTNTLSTADRAALARAMKRLGP
jgi:DNA-binding MarR family transcriptional regulator